MSPSPTITLSKAQARGFLLAHHHLWPPRQLQGKAGVLDYVRRVSCLQFDPLNIVGHNPELVLQARVNDFRPAILQELLYEDRALLDGWDKNAAIYPVEDWPFFRRQRQAARRNPGKSHEAVEAALPQVRQAIEERGPISSIDLDLERTVDWSWAPTRLARATLESMYAWGELIIHHRVHTRKVYDFAHRHLPDDLLSAPDPNKTTAAYHDWYVLRRIGGLGLIWNRSGSAWLGMGKIKSEARTAALARLLEQEEVLRVEVEGIAPPLYMRAKDRPTLERVLNEPPPPAPRAAILAPLDNLLWDRRFVEALFGFDYVWEVYKPANKRLYGYYVLPILYGDQLVARFESIQDPEARCPIIKGWWWEEDVCPDDEMQTELACCLNAFAHYLDAEQVQLGEEVSAKRNLEWL